MREDGGNCPKYVKREWNRKEVKENKDLKKMGGGQTGLRGGCLKRGGLKPPYELCFMRQLMSVRHNESSQFIDLIKLVRIFHIFYGTDLGRRESFKVGRFFVDFFAITQLMLI